MLNEGSPISNVTFYMVPFTVDLWTTAPVHVYMYLSLNICCMIHTQLAEFEEQTMNMKG